VATAGQFEVQGISEAGVEFTNDQNIELSYTFSPSGTWTPDKNNAALAGCGPGGVKSLPVPVQEGLQSFLPQVVSYLKYPKNTPFALLAVSKTTGAVTEVATDTKIVLKPKETLIFILNDLSWGYADNSGAITVKWSAQQGVKKEFEVKAKENSVTGGTPLKTGIAVAPGDILVVNVPPNQSWFLVTGQEDAEANANGRRPKAKTLLALYRIGNFEFVYGALVGSFDGGKSYFPVGTHLTMTILNSGTLTLHFWDSDSANNSGSVKATVEVYKGAAP
jgi:hypothetical protein